jgi:hypothetical protein
MNPDNDHLVAIMAVDPGTVTGVATAILPKPHKLAGIVQPKSVWGGLADKSARWETYEEDSDLARQAWSIMDQYREWREPYRYNHIVFEGFALRQLGSDSLLDPVRVTWGCEALSWSRAGHRWAFIKYQMPSAKNFATNDRLRRHGLWVKGSEHRRDAVRHIAAFYADLIMALQR